MLWDAALRFPTVVFTIGLGIVLVYWLFVVLGALDIDLFGHDVDIGGGGHDIGVGGHDVGGHDVGGHDGHGHDADADGGGIWQGLGLGVVPLTISISVIALVCWCMSLLVMHYTGAPSWLSAVMVPGALLVSLPITGLLVRPLAPIFKLKEGKSNKDYVGHTCTVTTGSVDDGFGQGTVEDGGTVLVIPIRCDKHGALTRGTKALIIDFDESRQAYVVEPTADMLPEPKASEEA